MEASEREARNPGPRLRDRRRDADACGWEIDGNSAYAEPLDAQVNRLEQLRPAPQAAKDEPATKPQRVA